MDENFTIKQKSFRREAKAHKAKHGQVGVRYGVMTEDGSYLREGLGLAARLAKASVQVPTGSKRKKK